MKNLTWDETVKLAEGIIESSFKRMGVDGFNWEVILPERQDDNKKDHPFLIHGEFIGNVTIPARSMIRFNLANPHRVKGTRKLAVWKAAVRIGAIHEASHFLYWKEMTVTERALSNTVYDEYGTWGEIEEVAAWSLTLKWLKRLNYHRSKSIINTLRKFQYPRNLVLPAPFDKKQ